MRLGFGLVIVWSRTGDAHFPSAVRVDGQWWVLRVNGFPDHPLWTLFVDGVAREHVEDAAPGWTFDGPPLATAEQVLASAGQVLASTEQVLATAEQALASTDQALATAEQVLAPLRGLEAFGSEDGNPCDGPYCCG